MSKNIQKAAYTVSLLAVMVVAFFGLSTVASAQSYDEGYYYDDGNYGYYDNSYDPYGYYGDTSGYYDPYDGYYDQPSNWNDYSNYGTYNDPYAYSYDPYANSYDPYAYSGGSYYDQTCYTCGTSYDYYDHHVYNDTYDVCYYYDCSQTCTTCNTGTQDTIVDVWNYNVNTNTNYPPVTNHDHDHDDDHNDNDDDFSVSCKADDRNVEEGDRVRWIAEVDGVSESKVDFSWSGDADGDDQEVTERYNKSGTYEAKVRARYKGQTETDTCTVRVEDEDDNDDDSNVTLVSNPPTGTPASLNSVYLSQVPYTGAADNAKLIGFITMLTLSSLAGAYYIVTRKARADRKSFIERFKQENYSTKA